jgi:hypothetical protein
MPGQAAVHGMYLGRKPECPPEKLSQFHICLLFKHPNAVFVW